ncbi:glycosyltransferase family 2 protein [Streptomonospora litoralis]|uniref:Glucosyl-3-phosphoglycerate synthase n=1 Tax=Streptomonospora litoralis TaxID=2498135 RepID=A0A4P6PUU3_9ACTN|nr:glycosyltransferase [Streptomonospora litoralis]QBI51908.1 Glycosyl transferase family 2 [Streptomonospora litoralis]
MSERSVPDPASPGLAVVIAARDEEWLIGATVRAAAALPGAAVVLVVDDGSRDDTAAVAGAAGALVLRHGANRGKGAAMETGAEGVRLLEDAAPRSAPRHLLFLDADLGESAAGAAPLAEPVCSGAADMTIALLPPTRLRLGGHGYVGAFARDGIRRATGWEPEQPLSGQRCLTRAAFESVRPLAAGFGAETGMTVDVLRMGFTVVEVDVPLEHRPTGTDLRGQLHRARQFAAIARALAERELRPALARRGRRLRQDVRAAASATAATARRASRRRLMGR